MCHMVPICHFLADLKVFSYIVSHYLYVYVKCFVSHHSYLCGVEVYPTRNLLLNELNRIVVFFFK